MRVLFLAFLSTKMILTGQVSEIEFIQALKDGPAKATELIAKAGLTEKSAQYFNQLAWSNYYTGDFDSAKRHAVLVEALDPNYSLVTAYLKSLILSRSGSPEEAIQTIISCCVDVEHLQISYNSKLELVRLYSKTHQFSEAEKWLQEAGASIDLAGSSPGHFYAVESQMYFFKGMYYEALTSAEDSYSFYYRDSYLPGMIDAVSSKAFFLMLIGRYQEARILSDSIYGQLIETGDKNKFYYHLINEVLYRRCYSSEDFGSLVNLISDKASFFNDQQLKYYLEFVLEIDCPGTDEVGESDPPPINPGGKRG